MSKGPNSGIETSSGELSSNERLARSLDLVRLAPLMEITSGRTEVTIGLIDGPIDGEHRELKHENIRVLAPGGHKRNLPAEGGGMARMHGTFIAGILSGRRTSTAPAICPGCTLLLRPIFEETAGGRGQEIPTASFAELAAAIVECVDAGAHVINLSVAPARPSLREQSDLHDALDYAARRGAIVVAAAGNQGALGSSAITRHHGVIPVIACDLHGRPSAHSNLGSSTGRRGLRAPGERVTSLGPDDGHPLTLDGSSVAAPFVTGTIALLLSAIPDAAAADLRLAVTRARRSTRAAIIPPLLDAWEAYQTISRSRAR
jgi:subtilisin family serine protease